MWEFVDPVATSAEEWLEYGNMTRANTLIFLDSRDNIAIALQELQVGEVISQSELNSPLKVRSTIPRGHKIALTDIAKGDPIIKYGERMGHAYKAIERGAHVHTHNVIGDRVSTEPAAS
jgi:altronate dehydratase